MRGRLLKRACGVGALLLLLLPAVAFLCLALPDEFTEMTHWAIAHYEASGSAEVDSAAAGQATPLTSAPSSSDAIGRGGDSDDWWLKDYHRKGCSRSPRQRMEEEEEEEEEEAVKREEEEGSGTSKTKNGEKRQRRSSDREEGGRSRGRRGEKREEDEEDEEEEGGGAVAGGVRGPVR